ncbi:MAG: ABC transporter permease, partial [Propionibacteriaceae bacterium]|nr:ABC transporter permease [Propionibacteriaceae bacterium]
MTDMHINRPEEINTEGVDPAVATPEEAGASLWSDAWRIMRSRPLFWFSASLIAIFVAMAMAPQLFTSADPGYCDLSLARLGPEKGAWFGYDLQGCDVYSRTIYGARSSILVGTLTMIATVIIGGALGIIAGYSGGWVDALLSRIADVFFAIPLLLGGIIIMYTFRSPPGAPYSLIVGKVVFAMAILYWPNIFRLMRSSVLQVKPNEYVLAARALGASPARIILSHVLPNAVAPVIVVATIDLGAFITTEAALSFLGIGLQPPAISWGIAISEASGLGYIAAAPHMLLFPSLFLSLAVLGFIMLG